MAYQVDWFIDQRIIRSDLTNDVNIDEIKLLQSETTKLVEDGIPLVHLIVDVTQVTAYPKLLELRTIVRERNPDVGWTIIVGANPVMQLITTTVMQLTNSRFRLLSDFNSALDFLQAKDDTLAI